MKISIITVAFNSGNTIRQTIESVLSQVNIDKEYLIIDGKSKDCTIEIVDEYKSYIAKIISEPDSGLYDAMNKGIQLATGDVIGILNSDDIFYDCNILSKVASIFEDESIDCVYGNIIYFKEDPDIPVRIWKTKPYSRGFFLKGEVPPHPSLFVRKRVYDKLGLYKINYKIAADQEFMLRMLMKNNCKSFFLNEFFVKMRLGGVSTRNFNSFIISTREIKQAWNSNGFIYPFWLYLLRPWKKIAQVLKK